MEVIAFGCWGVFVLCEALEDGLFSRFATPPGMAPIRRASVVQRKGDFIFWCVGWFHETEILSETALDVHGYSRLDISPRPGSAPPYSQLTSEYSERALRVLKESGEGNEFFISLMGDVSKSCEKKLYASSSTATWHRLFMMGFAGALFLALNMLFLTFMFKGGAGSNRPPKEQRTKSR